ncbi:hypothetical protein C8J56DRAFT_1013906 [Mycena floridula]|nr:hypothetical protein C8J56DRAFT_1013906 [Mycena floridula]
MSATRRKISAEDDLEGRRARGEVACAECRRLKLKCSKEIPCKSCIRRGCPSICPNGSLSAGQGTRYVLADTSELWAKISEMGDRIRVLEDALAIFQAGVSSECHPLLQDDLLKIKFGPETHGPQPQARPPSPDLLDAFGTMTINGRGNEKYYGPSGGSETLFLASPGLDEYEENPKMVSVPPSVIRLSESFPFATSASDLSLDMLYSYLPEQPRAWSLCETYMQQGTWAFRPILRDELVDDYLTPIYKQLKDMQAQKPTDPISPHRLAFLFLVFAMGSIVDLTLEASSSQCNDYFQLGRAALSLQSVFDDPEIATVQAISLIAFYISSSGQTQTTDSTWSIMSLGCKIGQALGLHRDASRWDMGPKTVSRRRYLFWEMFSSETFYSISTGRPPAIRPSYVECQIPMAEPDASLYSRMEMDYYQWKYEFVRDVFTEVLEITMAAAPPPYKSILEIDRKLRAKTLPAHFNMFTSPEQDVAPADYMRGCVLGLYRSVVLMYVHRSFFAQAILDHPANPLRSPYAPSYLACYRVASGVIKSSLNHYTRFPQLCARWVTLWTHLFSAAIIVGCIVTRSPSSSMAPHAFIELGLACDLFQKGAIHSVRIQSGLGVLTRLREKANQVYSQFQSGIHRPSAPVGGDYGEDELALFGGQTRLLFSRLLNRSSSPHIPVTPTGVPNASTVASAWGDPFSDAHPSLVEYLSLLPPSQRPRASPSSSASPENIPFTPDSSTYYSDPVSMPPMTQGTEGFEMNTGEMTSPYLYDPMIGTGMSDMQMVGDSGIDEQWRFFLRESGLLNQ